MTSIDALHDCTRIPQLSTAQIVAMATELVARANQGKKDVTRSKALNRLKETLSTLREQWNQRGAEPGTVRQSRSADARADAAWGALHARLNAWVLLPMDQPEQETALALLRRLFPSGLRFLALPYRSQWAEADKRLQQIQSESLEKDLVRLVGAPFLAAVRSTHTVYGEVLGIVVPQDNPTPAPSLLEPLNSLRRAMRNYAIHILAQTDDEDPDSVAEAARLLAPINTMKEKRSSPTTTQEPTEEPVPQDPPPTAQDPSATSSAAE